MTARRHAIALWEEQSTLCFDREETLCLMHGIVIATPDLYLMALPVHSTMTDDQIYRNTHLRHMFAGASSPAGANSEDCPPEPWRRWNTCLFRHLSPPDMLHIVHCVGSLTAFSAIFRESAACQSITHLCYHRRRHLMRVPIHKIFRS